jgi:hypothetical protein
MRHRPSSVDGQAGDDGPVAGVGAQGPVLARGDHSKPAKSTLAPASDLKIFVRTIGTVVKGDEAY